MNVIKKVVIGSAVVMATAVSGAMSADAATVASSGRPTGGIIVVAAESEGGTVAPFDSDCGGIFDPCGIVNNRTNRSLEAARDSSSHTSCVLWSDTAKHPRKWVAPGRNSNQSPEYFKDTDCFRSTTCSVFYLGWHAPGEWIRIWSSVYIYDLGC